MNPKSTIKTIFETDQQLLGAGFQQDDCGQYVYTDESGLKIILYKVDEWEVDLTLPNGVTIGVDASTLTINTNQTQENEKQIRTHEKLEEIQEREDCLANGTPLNWRETLPF